MAARFTNLAANAAAGDGTNAGLRAYIGADPEIKFYTGNVAADHEDNPAGDLLATVVIGAFGEASAGVISSVGGEIEVTASGTVGCFALFKTGGTTKIGDGSVAETSGGDINFDETAWLDGGTCDLGTVTITVPPEAV